MVWIANNNYKCMTYAILTDSVHMGLHKHMTITLVSWVMDDTEAHN